MKIIILAVCVLALASIAGGEEAVTASGKEIALGDAKISEQDFKVCGYYCGPGWCSNRWISESSCVDNGVWGIPSDGGCADKCCRLHDYCCGAGTNRASCNDAIVNCIASSGCYFTACGAVVWAAMKIVSNWCCGSACPTDLMYKLEFALNMTSPALPHP